MKTADEGSPEALAEWLSSIWESGRTVTVQDVLDGARKLNRAAEARGRLEERERARPYLRHRPDCGKQASVREVPCTCGLDRWLSSEQPGAAAPSGTSGDAGKLERAGETPAPPEAD